MKCILLLTIIMHFTQCNSREYGKTINNGHDVSSGRETRICRYNGKWKWVEYYSTLWGGGTALKAVGSLLHRRYRLMDWLFCGEENVTHTLRYYKLVLNNKIVGLSLTTDKRYNAKISIKGGGSIKYVDLHVKGVIKESLVEYIRKMTDKSFFLTLSVDPKKGNIASLERLKKLKGKVKGVLLIIYTNVMYTVNERINKNYRKELINHMVNSFGIIDYYVKVLHNIEDDELRLLRKLQRIKYFECNNLQAGKDGYRNLSNLKSVVELHLSASENERMLLEGLKRFRNLSKLSIRFTGKVANVENGIRSVGFPKELRSLRLNVYPKIGKDTWSEVWKLKNLLSLNIASRRIDLSGMQKLKKLERLTLDYGKGNLENVNTIKYMKELKALVLIGNKVGLMEHLSARNKLIKLSLNEVDSLDIKRKTIKKLEKLKHLTITRSSFAEGFFRIFKELKGLQTLRIFDYEDLKYTEVKELKELKNLETLVLESRRIGDRSIEIITRFKKLRYLDISFTSMTDKGLRMIGNRLKYLETLKMNGTRITNRGLKSLERLRKLKTIYARYTKITKNGVKDFKNENPECYVFWSSHEEDVESNSSKTNSVLKRVME